jgi:hypothetical protein
MRSLGKRFGGGAGRRSEQQNHNAVTPYRNQRRAEGRSRAAKGRPVDTDGHISSDWFRANNWYKAIDCSGIDLHVNPHGLRHAHASSLAAPTSRSSMPGSAAAASFPPGDNFALSPTLTKPHSKPSKRFREAEPPRPLR